MSGQYQNIDFKGELKSQFEHLRAHSIQSIPTRLVRLHVSVDILISFSLPVVPVS